MTGSPLEAARRVLDILDALAIPHVVVGSVATSLVGVPRATVDTDLVMHLEDSQVEELVAALAEEFYVSDTAVREALRRGSLFNAVHLATGYKVDLHLAGRDPYEHTKLARRIRFPLADGASIPVATPEDLVLSKLQWFRLGGEQSERQWNDVLGVLRVHGNLDREYLERWAEYLGVADLWLRARSQTS